MRVLALKRDHYCCAQCQRNGRPFEPANTVHHIISREDAPELALELSNLESVCAACHNKLHPGKAFRRMKLPDRKPAQTVRVIRM